MKGINKKLANRIIAGLLAITMVCANVFSGIGSVASYAKTYEGSDWGTQEIGEAYDDDSLYDAVYDLYNDEEVWSKGELADFDIDFDDPQYSEDYTYANITVNIKTVVDGIVISSVRQVGTYGDDTLATTSNATASDATESDATSSDATMNSFTFRTYANSPAYIINYDVADEETGMTETKTIVVADEDVTQILNAAKGIMPLSDADSLVITTTSGETPKEWGATAAADVIAPPGLDVQTYKIDATFKDTNVEGKTRQIEVVIPEGMRLLSFSGKNDTSSIPVDMSSIANEAYRPEVTELATPIAVQISDIKFDAPAPLNYKGLPDDYYRLDSNGYQQTCGTLTYTFRDSADSGITLYLTVAIDGITAPEDVSTSGSPKKLYVTATQTSGDDQIDLENEVDYESLNWESTLTSWGYNPDTKAVSAAASVSTNTVTNTIIDGQTSFKWNGTTQIFEYYDQQESIRLWDKIELRYYYPKGTRYTGVDNGSYPEAFGGEPTITNHGPSTGYATDNTSYVSYVFKNVAGYHLTDSDHMYVKPEFEISEDYYKDAGTDGEEHHVASPTNADKSTSAYFDVKVISWDRSRDTGDTGHTEGNVIATGHSSIVYFTKGLAPKVYGVQSGGAYSETGDPRLTSTWDNGTLPDSEAHEMLGAIQIANTTAFDFDDGNGFTVDLVFPQGLGVKGVQFPAADADTILSGVIVKTTKGRTIDVGTLITSATDGPKLGTADFSEPQINYNALNILSDGEYISEISGTYNKYPRAFGMQGSQQQAIVYYGKVLDENDAITTIDSNGDVYHVKSVCDKTGLAFFAGNAFKTTTGGWESWGGAADVTYYPGSTVEGKTFTHPYYVRNAINTRMDPDIYIMIPDPDLISLKSVQFGMTKASQATDLGNGYNQEVSKTFTPSSFTDEGIITGTDAKKYHVYKYSFTNQSIIQKSAGMGDLAEELVVNYKLQISANHSGATYTTPLVVMDWHRGRSASSGNYDYNCDSAVVNLKTLNPSINNVLEKPSALTTWKVLPVPELKVAEGIKSQDETDYYTYNGQDYSIASVAPNKLANVKIDYRNDAENAYEKFDMYLSVPGQNGNDPESTPTPGLNYFNNNVYTQANTADPSIQKIKWTGILNGPVTTAADNQGDTFKVMYSTTGSNQTTAYNGVDENWEPVVGATWQDASAITDWSAVKFIKFVYPTDQTTPDKGILPGTEGEITLDINVDENTATDGDINYFRTYFAQASTAEDSPIWLYSDVLAARVSTGMLAGFAFIDKDADGIYTEGTDELLDGETGTTNTFSFEITEVDNPVNTWTVKPDEYGGFYKGYLKNKNYRITITNNNPTTYGFTKPNQGGDDTKDSDIISSDNINGTFTINPIAVDNGTDTSPNRNVCIGLVEAKTVTYVAGANGSITGITSENVYMGQNPTGTTATGTTTDYSLSGYKCDKDVTLTDGRTITADTLISEADVTKIKVMENITLTAQFATITVNGDDFEQAIYDENGDPYPILDDTLIKQYGNVKTTNTTAEPVLDPDDVAAIKAAQEAGQTGKFPVHVTVTDTTKGTATDTFYVTLTDKGTPTPDPTPTPGPDRDTQITANNFTYGCHDASGNETPDITEEQAKILANTIARDVDGNLVDRVNLTLPDQSQLAAINAHKKAGELGSYPLTFKEPGGKETTIMVTLTDTMGIKGGVGIAGNNIVQPIKDENGNVCPILDEDAIKTKSDMSAWVTDEDDEFTSKLPAENIDLDDADVAAVTAAQTAGQTGVFPVKATATDPATGKQATTTIYVTLKDAGTPPPDPTPGPGPGPGPGPNPVYVDTQIAANNFEYPVKDPAAGNQSPLITPDDSKKYAIAVAKDVFGNEIDPSLIDVDQAQLDAINEKIKAGETGTMPLTFTEPGGHKVTIDVKLTDAGTPPPDPTPIPPIPGPTPGPIPVRKETQITGNDFSYGIHSDPEGTILSPDITEDVAKKLASVVARDVYGNPIDLTNVTVGPSQLQYINDKKNAGIKGTYPLTFTEPGGHIATVNVTLTDVMVDDGNVGISGNNFIQPIRDEDGNPYPILTDDDIKTNAALTAWAYTDSGITTPLTKDDITLDPTDSAALKAAQSAGQTGKFPVKATATDPVTGKSITTTIYVTLKDAGSVVPTPDNKVSQIAGDDFDYAIYDGDGIITPDISPDASKIFGAVIAKDKDGNPIDLTNVVVDQTQLDYINAQKNAGKVGTYPLTFTDPDGNKAVIKVTLKGKGVNPDPDPTKPMITITANDVSAKTSDRPSDWTDDVLIEKATANAYIIEDAIKRGLIVTIKDRSQLDAANNAKGSYPVTFTTVDPVTGLTAEVTIMVNITSGGGGSTGGGGVTPNTSATKPVALNSTTGGTYVDPTYGLNPDGTPTGVLGLAGLPKTGELMGGFMYIMMILGMFGCFVALKVWKKEEN